MYHAILLCRFFKALVWVSWGVMLVLHLTDPKIEITQQIDDRQGSWSFFKSLSNPYVKTFQCAGVLLHSLERRLTPTLGFSKKGAISAGNWFLMLY